MNTVGWLLVPADECCHGLPCVWILFDTRILVIAPCRKRKESVRWKSGSDPSQTTAMRKELWSDYANTHTLTHTYTHTYMVNRICSALTRIILQKSNFRLFSFPHVLCAHVRICSVYVVHLFIALLYANLVKSSITQWVFTMQNTPHFHCTSKMGELYITR